MGRCLRGTGLRASRRICAWTQIVQRQPTGSSGPRAAANPTAPGLSKSRTVTVSHRVATPSCAHQSRANATALVVSGSWITGLLGARAYLAWALVGATPTPMSPIRATQAILSIGRRPYPVRSRKARPLTTVPYPIDQFSGLNLLTDPAEVGATGAVDLSNVVFDVRGQLRTRPGLVLLTSAVTYAARLLHFTSAGAAQILAVDTTAGGTIYARQSNGTAIASQAALVFGAAAIGSPTASAVYFPSSSGLYKWTGAAFSLALTSTESKGRSIAATKDFRLAIGQQGTGTTKSRVGFSDAGAPETLGVNNYVDIQPGDGENIEELVAWRDLLFAFKRTKYAVFTGTSVDGSGNPVFNNYMVAAGKGVWRVDSAATQACAADNGVYFIADDGLYITTGPTPVRVSTPIDPWWRGRASPASYGSTFNVDGISFSRGRLFLAVSDAVTAIAMGTLIYDISGNYWTVFSFTASQVVTVPYDTAETVVCSFGGGLFRHSDAYTTDNGSAISWSWTSGLYSPAGDRGRVAISLESQIVGSGTATLRVATTGGVGSSAGAFDTGSAVTMGTAPALAEGWQQIDREGAMWQHKLSGSGAATVSGLSHYLSFVKPSGSW